MVESESPAAGQAPGSLAATPTDTQTAATYRAMSMSSVAQLALDLLATAKEQNPLASQIDAAAAAVRAVALP